MKKVFILGGSGFVGSNLTIRLLDLPEVQEVTVFDVKSYTTTGPIHLAGKKFHAVMGNAKDYDFLRVAMVGCDTVFHLAANPDIARAVTEPTIDFENGTVLTQNVLEAMRVNGVKNLYYLSGSGVYGDCSGVLLDEYEPCSPISTYGASKLASEALISAYCEMFGLRARILRPANIVGPRQTHGVGYDFLRKLKADPVKLTILGDGHQTKSYIHIDEVIDALLVLFNDGYGPCVIYNIASDDEITVCTIARLACDAMGLSTGSVEFEYTGGARGWKGDVPKVKLDTGMLRTATGWRPKMSSREAMRSALEAMKKEMG